MDNEFKLKDGFHTIVLRQLSHLEDGALLRQEAIQENSKFVDGDDLWSLETLANIDQYLQKLRRRYYHSIS